MSGGQRGCPGGAEGSGAEGRRPARRAPLSRRRCAPSGAGGHGVPEGGGGSGPGAVSACRAALPSLRGGRKEGCVGTGGGALGRLRAVTSTLDAVIYSPACGALARAVCLMRSFVRLAALREPMAPHGSARPGPLLPGVPGAQQVRPRRPLPAAVGAAVARGHRSAVGTWLNSVLRRV